MRIAKRNLEKQSQFAEVQMNTAICFTMSYENESALRLRKNKANQSQFQTGRLLINRVRYFQAVFDH